MNLSFNVPSSNPVNKERVYQRDDNFKNILNGCQAKSLRKG